MVHGTEMHFLQSSQVQQLHVPSSKPVRRSQRLDRKGGTSTTIFA